MAKPKRPTLKKRHEPATSSNKDKSKAHHKACATKKRNKQHARTDGESDDGEVPVTRPCKKAKWTIKMDEEVDQDDEESDSEEVVKVEKAGTEQPSEESDEVQYQTYEH